MSRGPEDEGPEPGTEPFRALTEAQFLTHVVERLRGERGMEAVLQASGVSRRAWTRAAAGEARLTTKRREKLALALGLTLDQLDTEIAKERSGYLRWLEAHQSKRPESPFLAVAVEELRCSSMKAGIDRIASGLKRMVDSYYEGVITKIREAAGAEKASEAPAEPRSEEVPQ